MKNWKQGEEGRGVMGRLARGLRGLARAASLGACTLMLVLNPDHSQAQTIGAPDVIPYQGTLVNGDSVPLGSTAPKNYDVVFRIYDAVSAGTLLWSELQTVTLDAGRYSVQLGLGTANGTEPRPAAEPATSGTRSNSGMPSAPRKEETSGLSDCSPTAARTLATSSPEMSSGGM